MTLHYKYEFTPKIRKTDLPMTENAGHGDHFRLLGADNAQVQAWLSDSLERATVSVGLDGGMSDERLIVGSNDTCHIKQVFGMNNGKPNRLLTVFPCVSSPYGLECKVQQVIACKDTTDAVLQLETKDGTTLYAYDTLHAINGERYEPNRTYYVNFSAWAYELKLSSQNEIIVVDDPKAIRYHRAFNDIVAANAGNVPHDIDEQIKRWQPDSDAPLAPVEINLGHSCIYLYGETFGQEDEAWCQGQVLGKSHTVFFNKDIILFDVVILRELDSQPFVVRIATPTNETAAAIQVQDYIQANIWLQAAIFHTTQSKNHPNQEQVNQD